MKGNGIWCVLVWALTELMILCNMEARGWAWWGWCGWQLGDAIQDPCYLSPLPFCHPWNDFFWEKNVSHPCQRWKRQFLCLGRSLRRGRFPQKTSSRMCSRIIPELVSGWGSWQPDRFTLVWRCRRQRVSHDVPCTLLLVTWHVCISMSSSVRWWVWGFHDEGWMCLVYGGHSVLVELVSWRRKEESSGCTSLSSPGCNPIVLHSFSLPPHPPAMVEW